MDLRVNHGVLDSTASSLSTKAADIQGVLDQMDSELRQLQANWDGEAKQAYEAAKAQWTAGMNGLRALLQRISTSVSDANTDYADTDRRQAGGF
nr:WXG100 family type VII secretion target [Propionicimonas sp.]